MTSTRADLEAGRALVRAVLAPFERKPGAQDIAASTGQLRHLGDTLLPEVIRLRPDANAALASWEFLIDSGAESGPFGTWTHARALARTLRTMMDLLARDAAR